MLFLTNKLDHQSINQSTFVKRHKSRANRRRYYANEQWSY